MVTITGMLRPYVHGIGSRQTLFTIQTLSGWDHIAAVLSGVYPSTVVVPLIIIYMMLCCFAVIGLITSVISDSFMASQQKEQKNQEVGKALRYENVTRHLEEWFFQYGRQGALFLSVCCYCSIC